MKQTVYFSTFQTAFESIRPDNFTYEGLTVLFDYFEELESDCGIEIELDVIAICCEYSEESYQDIAINYDIDLSQYEDDEERLSAVEDHLRDEGVFIGSTSENSIVYRVY